MVDALREARRALAWRGVLIDLRPLVAPIVVEVIVAAQPNWTKEVASHSAPDDVRMPPYKMPDPAAGSFSRKAFLLISRFFAIPPRNSAITPRGCMEKKFLTRSFCVLSSSRIPVGT